MEMGEDPQADVPLPPFLRRPGQEPVPTPEPRPIPVVTEPIPGLRSGQAALARLPVPVFTRRRIAWVLGTAVALWIVVVFMRQVGDAAAAQARADEIRASNQILAASVDALAAERELIQTASYVAFAARAYSFGDSRERPFNLAPGAPPLGPDAPGSAGLRVGHREDVRAPLDSWLEILFGPER